MAVVLMLLALAGLCLIAPEFFDASRGQERIWHAVGVVVASIAVLGALVVAANVSASEAMNDFGVGMFVVVVCAGLVWAAEAWSPPTPFTGLLKALAFGLAPFAVYGTASAVTRTFSQEQREKRRQPRSIAKNLISLLVGLLGLATAVVNLMEAVSSKPPTP